MSRRAAGILACGSVLLACGSLEPTTNVTPSPTPSSVAPSSALTSSPSPSASSVIPDATLLTSKDCSGAAFDTAPKQLDRYLAIRPASNWSQSPRPQSAETLLLELRAPASYGFPPTFIQFHSLIGPVHMVYGAGATAHSIAQQHATAIAEEWSPDASAGPVSDCHLGGEPASAFGFSGDLDSSSTPAGKFLRIYVVHDDGLFEVMVIGTGGIGDQTVRDSLGMLGSLTWTS